MAQSTEQITKIKITYKDILADSTEYDTFELPFDRNAVLDSIRQYNKVSLLELEDRFGYTAFIFTDTIAKIEVH